MQQLTLFAMPAKLQRKNEYEISHCSNCGCIVPDRIILGNWPGAIYRICFCPNCGAKFDQEQRPEDIERLKRGWKWEAVEIFCSKG